MRVMVTTDTVGGVWTYTQELVEGFTGREHEVMLVSFGRMPSDAQQQWAAVLAQRSPHLFRFLPTDYKLEWMPDGHASFQQSCDFLQGLIERESPDIFHSNQLGYGALPVRIPKIVVAHSDVVSWWHARHGSAPPSSPWTDRYVELVSRGLAGAHVVVTPTAWMRDQLVTLYPESCTDCRVIYNGRTALPTSNAAKKLQAVTAGRLWDEGKNVRILLEIESRIPICIAGEVAAPGEASAAPPQRTPANVTFLGALHPGAMRDLLEESALYIATSLYEPFGLAPLEAALAGCALVLNDIPSLREVWGDAAAYYQRNNAASLQATLAALAASPDTIATLAAAASRRAREHFKAALMTDRYCALYDELQAGGLPAAPAWEVHVA